MLHAKEIRRGERVVLTTKFLLKRERSSEFALYLLRNKIVTVGEGRRKQGAILKDSSKNGVVKY